MSERATGQPWGDFVRDEIARPLGLNATLSCDAVPPEERTHGYQAVESTFAPNSIYAEPGCICDYLLKRAQRACTAAVVANRCS